MHRLRTTERQPSARRPFGNVTRTGTTIAASVVLALLAASASPAASLTVEGIADVKIGSGRAWWLDASASSPGHAEARSRDLRSRTERRLPLNVAPLNVATSGSSAPLPPESVSQRSDQLILDGDDLFVQSVWYWDPRPEGLLSTLPVFTRFDRESGAQRATDASGRHLLPGSTPLSAVAGSTVTDARTGAPVGGIVPQEFEADVQGRFAITYTGRSTAGRNLDQDRFISWARARVSDRQTGRPLYSVTATRLRALAGGANVIVEFPRLRPDGTLAVTTAGVNGRRGFRGLWVDRRGKIHRSAPIDTSRTITVSPGGHRAILTLNLQPDGYPRLRCDRVWLTNANMTEGRVLRASSHRTGPLAYWDGSVATWSPRNVGTARAPRTLLSYELDLEARRLSRSGRPRC